MAMETWELEFYKYLEPYVTDHKKNLIDRILDSRTRYLTIALEHMIKPHNGSAALRTAECLGLQTAHIITTKNYKSNLGVVKGATKWLDVELHQARNKEEATRLAIEDIKERGYKIVVTSPHSDGYTPENLPLDAPIALWLGNEQDGISEQAEAHADYTLTIPMHGFTESYNVSVSAALCLYTILNRLRKQDEVKWQLEEDEAFRLKINWYEKIVRHAGRVKPVIQKKYA
jgi:tRNA (guanosine-2'-O-)-methyltransferase